MLKLAAIFTSAVLGLASVTWLVVRNKSVIARHYNSWRYPPIKEQSKLAADIKKDLDIQRYNDVAREYKRVERLLDKAEKEGKNVAWLKRKMPRIVRLMNEKKYPFAKIHLNTIDVRIPRSRESVKPASRFDHNEGMTPDIEGTKVRGRKRRSTKKRGRRSRKKRTRRNRR